MISAKLDIEILGKKESQDRAPSKAAPRFWIMPAISMPLFPRPILSVQSVPLTRYRSCSAQTVTGSTPVLSPHGVSGVFSPDCSSAEPGSPAEKPSASALPSHSKRSHRLQNAYTRFSCNRPRIQKNDKSMREKSKSMSRSRSLRSEMRH